MPELLRTMVEMQGSDLHLTTNTPPQVRVHGCLRRLPLSDLTPADSKQLASGSVNGQIKLWEVTGAKKLTVPVLINAAPFKFKVAAADGRKASVPLLVTVPVLLNEPLNV